MALKMVMLQCYMDLLVDTKVSTERLYLLMSSESITTRNNSINKMLTVIIFTERGILASEVTESSCKVLNKWQL
jgi:hypothetical protein